MVESADGIRTRTTQAENLATYPVSRPRRDERPQPGSNWRLRIDSPPSLPLDHGAVIGKKFGGSVQPLRSFEASVLLDGSEDMLDDLSPVYGDRQDPVRKLAGLV